MNARGFQCLLWSTIIAGAAAIWLVRADQSAGAPRAAPGGVAAPYASRAGDVVAIDIETPDYSLNLVKRGEAWAAADRGDYPAQAAAVANLLTSLAAMDLLESKTAKPDLYKDIGVEDRGPGAASTLYSFQFAGGAGAGGVIIGKRSASASMDQTGATFVRRAGGQQAWLAKGAPNAPRDFSDWLAPLPNVPAADAKRIVITEGDKTLFDVEKDAEGRFKRSGGAEPAANDTAVRRLPQALVSTSFEDARPVAALGAPTRRIHFELDTGPFDIILADFEGKPYVRFEGTAGGPAGDLVKTAAGFAYRLPPYRLSALTQSLESLTAPEPPPAPPQEMPPGFPGMQGLPPGMRGMPGGPPGGLPPQFMRPGVP